MRSSIDHKIRDDLVPHEMELFVLTLLGHIANHFLLQQFIHRRVHYRNFWTILTTIKATDNENKEMYMLRNLNCNMLKEINILTYHYIKLSHSTNYINFTTVMYKPS